MADEITISLNVDVAAGNYKASFRPGTIQPNSPTTTASLAASTTTN